jgi:hypothetical protein
VENSPTFEYDAYWAKIVHGKPVAPVGPAKTPGGQK